MQKETQNNSKKRIFWLLILLLLLNGITFFFFLKQRQETLTVTERNKNLTSDKMALQSDLEQKKQALEQIETDNAELQEQIDKQKEQIVVYLERLKKNEKDLKFLADVRIKLKEYEKIVSDLQAQNRALQEQNALLSRENNDLKEESEALRKEKEEIALKLRMVNYLQAHDFQISGLRSKGAGKYVVVTKARSVNSLKTCFTVVENFLLEAGERILYLRIVNPKGQLLANEDDPENAFFTALNGEKVNFTEKRTIDYNQKALDACIFWNNQSTDLLLKGTYIFEVWAEGRLIGKSTMALK